ncbi:MAG: hypothetical protein ACLSVD_14410 [Eggerthellaceae bacterium]
MAVCADARQRWFDGGTPHPPSNHHGCDLLPAEEETESGTCALLHAEGVQNRCSCG